MKALSIMQPWAWLIVNGYKPVENRTWETLFRGEFLIHAGKKFDHDALAFVPREIKMPAIEDFPRGGIVGMAKIVACIREHHQIGWVDEAATKWFTGPFGFILRDARPLPFTPLMGRLRFFEVEGHEGMENK